MIKENTVALIVFISRKLQILEISCFPLKSFLILGPSTGFHMAFSTIVFCNFVKCIHTFPSIYESITDRALLFWLPPLVWVPCPCPLLLPLCRTAPNNFCFPLFFVSPLFPAPCCWFLFSVNPYDNIYDVGYLWWGFLGSSPLFLNLWIIQIYWFYNEWTLKISFSDGDAQCTAVGDICKVWQTNEYSWIKDRKGQDWPQR